MGKWLNLIRDRQGEQKNLETPDYHTDKTDKSTPLQSFGSFGGALVERFQEKHTRQQPDTGAAHPGLQQWQTLYGKPQEAKEDPPSLTVVAEAHGRTEWIAARDNWHRHYFACKVCQRHHKQQIRRPFSESPCTEGQQLRSTYEELC